MSTTIKKTRLLKSSANCDY